MPMIESKAGFIKDNPFLIQLLCDLFTHPCDSKGWYDPSALIARYEREKGLSHPIQYVERFADDYQFMEWGGTEQKNKFRNTEAMDATLDDLKRQLGDRFRDPRDKDSRDSKGNYLPALTNSSRPTTPAPRHVSTAAPHREDNDTGVETDAVMSGDPVPGEPEGGDNGLEIEKAHQTPTQTTGKVSKKTPIKTVSNPNRG